MIKEQLRKSEGAARSSRWYVPTNGYGPL